MGYIPSLFRISHIRFFAPQRSLSMATTNAESDGPFRSLRFRIKPIRHDFQNVLVHADAKKLIATAHELLEHAHVRKSIGFWDIYRKRVILTHTHLSLLQTAVVLRAFDVHKQNKGVYITIANTISSGITGHSPPTYTAATTSSSVGRSSSGRNSCYCSMRCDCVTLPGIATVMLLDIFSRRLKKEKKIYEELFFGLANHVCNVMYMLEPADIVEALYALHRAGVVVGTTQSTATTSTTENGTTATAATAVTAAPVKLTGTTTTAESKSSGADLSDICNRLTWKLQQQLNTIETPLLQSLSTVLKLHGYTGEFFDVVQLKIKKANKTGRNEFIANSNSS
eukprot:GHVS01075230.1.p1 GENE.GHVS01075230.1~~GHVS01075230.1.p1  ORF type:complete len:339 (-),score=65.09 GHVS01075230.1:142-1158(-)